MKEKIRKIGSFCGQPLIASFIILYPLIAASCSASNSNGSSWIFDGSFANTAAGSTGYDASSFSSGSGGSTIVNPLGGAGAAGNVTRDSGMSDACASIVREPKTIEVTTERPVSIYVMLDQSRSMNEETGALSKWEMAVDSINTFINDSASADLEVALQYFPIENGECAGVGYSTPEVPMGLLPDHATNISTSLSSHTPGMVGGGAFSRNGGTPIEGALNGVTNFCTQYKQDTTANPDGRNCVAVLVTDGLPHGCSEEPTVLAGIATDAYANDEVITFAIGMTGADFTLLDQIAEQGHGDCTPDAADPSWSCDVSSGNMTFLDALNLIRDTVTEVQTIALECEWEIPAPPEDEEFNRDEVNVEFSATGLDADKQVFGRVDSEGQCGDKLGWYYDDMDNPTRIIACEQTCTTIQAAETGKINILLGCGTIELI